MTDHLNPPTRHNAFMLAIALSIVGLTGCQPKTSDDSKSDASTESELVTRTDQTPAVDDAETVDISPSAESTIKQYEGEYVMRMLNLQQSQQAEYEALTAADASDVVDTKSTNQDIAITQNGRAENSTSSSVSNETSALNTQPDANAQGADSDSEENAEAGETGSISATNESADISYTSEALKKLPLIDMATMPPEMLTASEIGSRYNVAMQSLYLPDDMPLPAQAMNTLLDIATLTPEVFSNQELAERLVVKSPALARLLKQYQTWAQIDAKKNAELEAFKQQQQQEFDKLTKTFNDKIASYDEQIEKYEQKLKEFE